MSDDASINNGSTATLEKDQAVLFTYPEGFNIVANSLHFLPEELRIQALTGLVMRILLM
jgi:hypothetical protein